MVRFVDRVEELGKLLDYAEKGFYPILAVYGSEGCGKTRLLKEFIDRVRGREDFVAVYIDALEHQDVGRALYVSTSIASVVQEVASLASIPVGKFLATNVSRILQLAEERIRFRGKHVVIAVDDVVRSVGLETVDVYVKNLLNVVEDLLWRCGAASVFVVISTSEGLSRYVLAKHRYSYDRLLWNLDRDSFEELVYELKPSTTIDVDELYRYTGGNPGKLMEIAIGYRWSLDRWFNDVETKIRVLVSDLLSDERLREVVNDIDALTRYGDLAKVLMERNLVIDIRSVPLGREVATSRDLGIGRFYAWQVPAYREAVRRVLEE